MARREHPQPPPAQPAPAQPPPPERVLTSFWLFSVHLFWVLIGPPLFILAGVAMLLSGTQWFGAIDIAFLVLVVLMLACRWVDQKSGVAVNSFGERTTWADFRMYAIKLVATSVLVWCGAHVVSMFLPDVLTR